MAGKYLNALSHVLVILLIILAAIFSYTDLLNLLYAYKYKM